MSRAEADTTVWPQDVRNYLDAISKPERKQDCTELAKIISEVTGYSPEMCGNAIIGFGSYHYKYDSGHEGDACIIGLSSRKTSISVYLAGGILDDELLLKRLGKVKAGKGCLYINRLGQVDLKTLREIIAYSLDVIRKRFGD